MGDKVTAAIVLGAPRSGTSMLTNITTALGLYAGEKDELFWDSDFYSNEKGFFELLALRNLSKSISEISDKPIDIPVINTIIQNADGVKESLADYFNTDNIFTLIDMIYDASK